MSTLSDFGEDADWRLISALVVATLLHAAVIAGVRFQFSEVPPVRVEQLAVAFAQVSNLKKPAPQAPAAAADHRGGGAPRAEQAQAVESSPVTPPAPEAAPVPPAPARTKPPATVAAEPSPSKPARALGATLSKVAPKPIAKRAPPPKPALSASALVRQARRLAQMSSSMPMAIESSNRDGSQDTGVDTRFSVREAYVDGWVRKVEDWGTRNFPDKARRQNLTGSLTLNVVLRYDGSVHEIRLLRSSGYEVLDDAAFRIVHLAAPFAPFPEELRSEEGDFLTITRTWQFLPGERLSSS